MEYLPYGDVALDAVYAIPEASRQIDQSTVLIYPNGMAWARVTAPENMRDPIIAQPRSRYARLGMQTGIARRIPAPDHEEKRRNALIITLINWAPSYGIIVRAEDIIVSLVNSSFICGFPLVEEIGLHAGETILRVNERALPRIDAHFRRIPCIDLRNISIEECTDEVPYRACTLRRGHLFLVDTREQPRIPKGHFGRICSVDPGLVQSASASDYHGSYGRRVLELKVMRKRVSVWPGKLLAKLRIYASLLPLPEYTGGNGRRASMTPAFD